MDGRPQSAQRRLDAAALNSEERALTQLIRSAFPPDGHAVPAPLIPSSAWSHLAQTAQRHGIAPLVYASLQKNGSVSEPPPGVGELLRFAYLKTSVASDLGRQVFSRLQADFARAGIPLIALKGSALAATLYPDAALRPLGDLDVLVPRTAARRAGALLQAQGFAPLLELADDFQYSFANEACFIRRGKRPAQVDLHWHLFPLAYYRRRIPIEWFWERTQEIRAAAIQPNGSFRAEREITAARTMRILSPAAQLLHLCSHFVLQHGGARLLWSYDLALLLARDREQLDWAETLAALRTFGLGRTIRAALAQVHESWEVAPPEAVSRELGELAPTSGERIVFTIATADHADARVLLDLLCLPGLRAKWRFGLRYLFPSVEYMRVRYQIGDTRWLPLFYFWRVGKGMRHLARSVFSIIARR